MRLLIDTHILLWAINDDNQLPAAARALLARDDTVAFVSAVSIWEISIKHVRNPVVMPMSGRQAREFVEESDFRFLSVTPEHAASIDALPAIHRDPFDRLLAAQAICEPLRLITHDKKLAAYGDSIMLV